MATRRPGRRWSLALGALAVAFGIVVHCPAALAFPYHRSVDGIDVFAERPIAPQIAQVVRRSQSLIAVSPIATARHGTQIFLTGGGWRWRVLVLQSADAFAISRPFSSAIVLNRNDVARDRIFNGRAVGGERHLSSVIAHEWTHQLVRKHFGRLADGRYPVWLTEGYADHISGESSLSDAQVADLLARHEDHPALLYHEGRRRVETELAWNGGSIDRLFAHWKKF